MKQLNSFFDVHFPSIDCIQWEIKRNLVVDMDILRLDQLHPQISGNKWYKLKYQFQDALKQGAKSVLSFGGAYS
ncbi:MAG TPA: hypothetical protein PLU10_08725, partial [Chitinophagaceae bacterium]|nr:hypothetical protein [Chitinophagaceae bacterium]